MLRVDICRVIIGLCLCWFVGRTAGRELCYTDSVTKEETYCQPNCCGHNPTYCCDKDTFVRNCAIFGGFGALFIVTMIGCCIYRKRKTSQKKAAAKKAAALAVKPKATTVSTISTGVHQTQNDGHEDTNDTHHHQENP